MFRSTMYSYLLSVSLLHRTSEVVCFAWRVALGIVYRYVSISHLVVLVAPRFGLYVLGRRYRLTRWLAERPDCLVNLVNIRPMLMPICPLWF